jgi:hypothetical protein
MKDPKEKNEDLVLVAKVGKQEEWLKAIKDAEQIAQGALGWRGHAEIMVDTDLADWIDKDSNGELNLPEDKEAKVVAMEEILKNMYLQAILDLSDEVTKEEADRRAKTTKVLYGE